MMYNPKKKLDETFQISSELEKLIQELAEYVHDAWAAERFADGWSYGDARDDVNKKHPSLKPYKDLDIGEQKYDIITAKTTILGIMKNGYKIQKKKETCD